MAKIIEMLKGLIGGQSAGVAPAPVPAGPLLPLIDTDSWARARAAPTAFVYKHSTICYTSAQARLQVEQFAGVHPAVPVFEVDVRANRDVSMAIANDLDIRHESPQIILLVDGQPQWHDSHWAIKLSALETALSAGA